MRQLVLLPPSGARRRPGAFLTGPGLLEPGSLLLVHGEFCRRWRQNFRLSVASLAADGGQAFAPSLASSPEPQAPL